jgi:hypothetical protein
VRAISRVVLKLFIGPKYHDLMGEFYDNRSSVEHLHEDRLLEPFDRTKRLELLRKEAMIEHIARTALSRIVANEILWPHFASRVELENFWELKPAERQKIWGSPVDPGAALPDFDPRMLVVARSSMKVRLWPLASFPVGATIQSLSDQQHPRWRHELTKVSDNAAKGLATRRGSFATLLPPLTVRQNREQHSTNKLAL